MYYLNVKLEPISIYHLITGRFKYNKIRVREEVGDAGSYFISQDEGMTESLVKTLEKAIILHLFWTEGLTSF